MKRKKHVESKAVVIDGIKFKSTLESKCYSLLKESNLNPKYEEEKFLVFNGFNPTKEFYIPRNRKKNEEKKRHLELQNKSATVKGIEYTPDFIVIHNGITNIIECKGRPNESFPLRRKMFRKLMETRDNIRYFEPHNIQNIKEMITIIKT